MEEIIHNTRLIAFADTDQGGRSENQDHMAWHVKDDGTLILTVCDGMGGAAGGRTASATATDAIIRYLSEEHPYETETEQVVSAVKAANDAVYDKSLENAELRGMGTTATVLMVKGNKAFAAHAGDSRIYHIRNGRKVFRTDDHSRVFELTKVTEPVKPWLPFIRKPLLTEEQARVHPSSNIITRALGIAPEIKVDTAKLAVKAGDRFLLCCDGVWNPMPEHELLDILNDEGTPERVLDILMRRANSIGLLHGGTHDNMTAILLQVES